LAVGGSVAFIVINAINREVVLVSTGKRPISEGFVFMPSLANLDAATAVIFECLGIRIAAPRQHGCPDRVKASVSVAVRGFARCGSLNSKAPARFRMPSSKISAVYDFFGAAVAAAQPMIFVCGVRYSFDDKPTRVSLSSAVYKLTQRRTP
jgi:hypothetical protein